LRCVRISLVQCINRIVGSQWFVSLASCGIRGLWLYQALLDIVRVLESVLGVVAYPQASLFEALGRVDRHRLGLEGFGRRHARTHLQQPTIRFASTGRHTDDKEQRHGQGHSASRWRQSTSRWWQKPCVAQRW
jgi:hypothetical protein